MTNFTPASSPYLEPGEVAPGVMLGRYEILVGIAQGGMARVWAAKQHGQRGFSKTVAVKTILPSLASDPEFEAMFLDEARVAAGVHHPNVCEIFDLGEEASTLYLAMEWVNGESLARILKCGPPLAPGGPPSPVRLNARLAARIVSDASAGLHAAHELCDHDGNRLNVVHRDVSPQNILISIDGNIKVTDFGVAKALGSAHETTMAGQIKGKAAYMSPEQAGGARVDRRSDIFALGIVLYESTTGQRPFRGDNQLGTIKQVLECRFDPPSAIVPGYPRELEAIVLRAMAQDPMQRFPTADRMRVALEEWIARSGPVVTQTQIGTMARERVGASVDERLAHIRQRMQASNPARVSSAGFSVPSEGSSSKISHPSQVSHVGSVSGPISSATPAPHVAAAAAQRGNPALLGVGIGLGVFALIAVIGGGAFLLLKPEASAADSAAPVAAAAGTPAAPAQTSSASAAAAGRSIRLRLVIPSSGVSFALGGHALEPGKLEIPRPASGAVELLTVKADGYKQDVLRIDDNTGDVLDVILAKSDAVPAGSATEAKTAEPAPVPAPQPAATHAPPAAPERPAAKPAEKPAEKPAAKKPTIKPDIPDNPF